MGLPRALRIGFLNDLKKNDKLGLFAAGFVAGTNANKRMVQAVKEAAGRGVSNNTMSLSILQWLYRHKKRPVTSSSSHGVSYDPLTPKQAKLYIGLVHRNGDDEAEFRSVEVPFYFLPRLEKMNEERENRDRDALDLRWRINQIRKRVYSSRTFPSTLKNVIFERDNYTCRLCLRDRVTLQIAGLHLECDHILAWEDGGPTTYDNGQTVCSDCNKAKHHAKHYLGLIARLHGGPSKK